MKKFKSNDNEHAENQMLNDYFNGIGFDQIKSNDNDQGENRRLNDYCDEIGFDQIEANKPSVIM